MIAERQTSSAATLAVSAVQKRRPPLKPELAALRASLDNTLLSDRRALSRALQNINDRKTDDPKVLDEWRAKLARAQQKFASRAALVPEIRIDESLPIAAKADDIVNMNLWTKLRSEGV